MSTRQYEKPPITEAVIELRFTQRATADQLTKFVRQVKTQYPYSQKDYDVSINVEVHAENTDPSTEIQQKYVGNRVSTEDGADLIIIQPDKIAAVRHPPYLGWDDLLEKAITSYRIMKKITGFRQLSRLGVRYINRIDIPANGREKFDTSEYVKLEPVVPAEIPTLFSFSTEIRGDLPQISGAVVVRSSTVQSPLIDHFSVNLDIDVMRTNKLSQKDEGWSADLEELRVAKDSIFEAFITDKSRELFGNA